MEFFMNTLLGSAIILSIVAFSFLVGFIINKFFIKKKFSFLNLTYILVIIIFIFMSYIIGSDIKYIF